MVIFYKLVCVMADKNVIPSREEGFFVAARMIRSNPADGRLKRL
jgi:hypothetical protein